MTRIVKTVHDNRQIAAHGEADRISASLVHRRFQSETKRQSDAARWRIVYSPGTGGVTANLKCTGSRRMSGRLRPASIAR